MEANKSEVHQDNHLNGDIESTISKGSSRIGWSGPIIKQKGSLYNDDWEAKDRRKKCLTLDNGSTLSLFSNPKLVQDIRTSSKLFHYLLQGLVSNRVIAKQT
jgi:hypothetical protein